MRKKNKCSTKWIIATFAILAALIGVLIAVGSYLKRKSEMIGNALDYDDDFYCDDDYCCDDECCCGNGHGDCGDDACCCADDCCDDDYACEDDDCNCNDDDIKPESQPLK